MADHLLLFPTVCTTWLQREQLGKREWQTSALTHFVSICRSFADVPDRLHDMPAKKAGRVSVLGRHLHRLVLCRFANYLLMFPPICTPADYLKCAANRLVGECVADICDDSLCVDLQIICVSDNLHAMPAKQARMVRRVADICRDSNTLLRANN